MLNEYITEGTKRCANINYDKQFLITLSIGILISAKSEVGIWVLKTSTISPLIVRVSGTLIVVAWAAAQMTSQYAERAKELMISVLEREDYKKYITDIRDDVEELRRHVAPSRKGVYASITSFLFSLLSLIVPDYKILECSVTIIVSELLCGISLSFLGMAVFNFIPAVIYSFQFNSLDSTTKALNELEGSTTPDNSTQDSNTVNGS